MSTMTRACSIKLSRESRIYSSHGCSSNSSSMIGKGRVHLINGKLSTKVLRQDAWNLHLLTSIHGPMSPVPSRCNIFVCRSVLTPGGGSEIPVIKSAAMVLTRSCTALHGSPVVLKLIPAVGIIAFAAWGLGPLLRLGRIVFLHKSDNSWTRSSTRYVMSSYLQPLLLWAGAMLICRALDPVVLPSEASQAVKQRLMNFMRSLSTVLAFAYCFSSLIQQAQQFFAETTDSSDGSRNMGLSFAAKAIYTAVWIAAVSLFMELLGFSTQRWLTAGGLGTVLLTLAGREIFTNFLSSIMIHATRPFVVNEWIQTKIEGYEVSGTVEHVGWWSPTIIRGDDREAVHIPNHKFTVNVVRNLSQKTHWRIKTHLAISHLDVHKINNIVADMRKVLAKNPQVEQQRLHRRVFLDNIDPETQALKILVSCFVKTSHFEEYSRVKEVILLDLLRVISHHRARLATPIRTVQKFYNGDDLENVPFADSIFASSSAAANRPLLLIEPSYKINGEEKVKPSNRSASSNEEKDEKGKAASMSEPKTEAASKPVSSVDTKSDSKASSEPPSMEPSKSELGNPMAKSKKKAESRQPGEDAEDIRRESPEVNSVERSTGGKAPERSTTAKQDAEKVSPPSSSEKAPEKPPTGKQDAEKVPAQSSPAGRAQLEENIVLGVALEGSKLTLPIEDETDKCPFPVESKEFASSRSGNSSAVKESQTPTVQSSSQSD